VTTNAPGCFGAASVFSHDSDICKRCPAFAACADKAVETLAAIKDVICVTDLLTRHKVAKRKAQAVLKAEDERAAKEAPPGNIEKPVTLEPTERKTPLTKVKIELSAQDESVVATLPVKIRPLAITLISSGATAELRKALQTKDASGVKSVPAWLRIALSALCSGGFTRASLRAALIAELGWTDSTAASHVSMVVALLPTFGATQETDGRIVVTPAPAA
jgi:hypothetical protein